MSCRNIILGGGISGLATGHYLLRAGNKQVKILEATDRVGGWIRSTRVGDDNVIFEQSARTLRPRGPQGANTLALAEELGLAGEIIPISTRHPTARNRMIYVHKQLHTLPSSLPAIFTRRAPFTKPLVQFLLNDLFAQKKNVDDESIYEFISRRFDKEIADYAISPLICGICAGDAKEISVKFLMKNFFDKEQKYGSICKGLLTELIQRKNKVEKEEECELVATAKRERWSVWSLRNGLESLPKTLHQRLLQEGVDFQFNTKCEQLRFAKNNQCVITTSNGQEERCERVFSSLPSSILAEMVHEQHPELATELKAIPTVTVGVVNLHYNKRVLNHEAFGFLVPPSENLPILGVIFDSCCFPNGENTVVTVMLGGRWFHQKFGAKLDVENSLLEESKRQLEEILNIYQQPDNYSILILKDCIPQYVVGHSARISRIKDYIENHKLPLHLVGNWFDGVGINDVIYHAKKTVERCAE